MHTLTGNDAATLILSVRQHGAGAGDGGVGLLADLGDLGVSAVADVPGAGVGGVGVGAGLVSGLQRGLGVLPGGVHRRGGGLSGLGACSGLGEGDSGFGLGLAAGGVSGGQRCGDLAGPAAASWAAAAAARPQAWVSSSCRPRSGPSYVAGRRASPAALRRRLRRSGCRCATCVSTPGCRTGGVRHARWRRAARCRVRAACSGAGQPPARAAPRSTGPGSRAWPDVWSVMAEAFLFFFSARERERTKKIRGNGACGRRGRSGGVLSGGLREGRDSSGPVAGAARRAALTTGHSGGVVAARHDMQPDPGRGGVLGRIRANRPPPPAVTARRLSPEPSRWRS